MVVQQRYHLVFLPFVFSLISIAAFGSRLGSAAWDEEQPDEGTVRPPADSGGGVEASTTAGVGMLASEISGFDSNLDVPSMRPDST
jgi:hypothetical protein